MKNDLHPADKLSMTRTILANERTLLSYLRSSLGAFIGGAGLIKFFGHPVYMIGGVVLLTLAIVWLVIGSKNYLKTKKLIASIDPEDWYKIERMLEKEREPQG